MESFSLSVSGFFNMYLQKSAVSVEINFCHTASLNKEELFLSRVIFFSGLLEQDITINNETSRIIAFFM